VSKAVLKSVLLAVGLVAVALPQGNSLRIKPSARSIQPGELVMLTITGPDRIDALRARAFDEDLIPQRVDDRTWQVIVGIDLDVAPGRHGVALRWTQAGHTSTQTATHTLDVTPKAFRTRTLTVPETFVNPPESAQAQIAADAKLIAQAWNSSTDERYWKTPFIAPVPHEANSAFGSRSVYNGQARSPHGGADFASPTGTPIKAPNTGRVVIARDMYYTGGTVAIDHGLGLVSLVAHLSKIDVKEGQMVQVGEIVGEVGATGRVTGPHLHWAVKARNARVDPLSLLAVLGAAGLQTGR
jgi:murein DD-endopeptidase MepM/ murein hydrolase activator NlpD